MATSLDVGRARGAAGVRRSGDCRNVEAALKQSIHRLSVLVGDGAGDADRGAPGAAADPAAPPRVIVGLPSELLLRRPDVRQAERRLAVATAAVGVATAELYPRFLAHRRLRARQPGLLRFPEVGEPGLVAGPSIRWPIFSGGRIRAQIAVQDAQQEQALASYEKSVLVALEDVENTLVAYLRVGRPSTSPRRGRRRKPEGGGPRGRSL